MPKALQGKNRLQMVLVPPIAAPWRRRCLQVNDLTSTRLKRFNSFGTIFGEHILIYRALYLAVRTERVERQANLSFIDVDAIHQSVLEGVVFGQSCSTFSFFIKMQNE